MSAKSTYILMLMVALVGACVDPITFETVSEREQLVLFGVFSQLNEEHQFEITRTTEFGQPVVPVSGACVTIIDNLGNTADYEEVALGKYQLDTGKIEGVPGRSYHIEVDLKNGKSYTSEPQQMPEPVDVDDIYFEFEVRQILSSSDILVDKTFIDVFIDTPLQNKSDQSLNFRWTIEEVYSFADRSCGPLDFANTCYFIDLVDESEVLLFENEGGTQQFLERLKVRSRELVPFDEFTGRHYFIVRQYTISSQELEYWQRIDAVANQSGNLFDIQPATVVGNIIENGDSQESVLGYFGVSGQTMARTFTTPFDIRPNPVFTCNDESFFRDHLPECCNCGLKAGIQIQRPAYWDED